MKDISKDLIKKIKAEHIKPTPKWHFLLRKSIIFTLFALSVIVGGFSISVIIFLTKNQYWDVSPRIGGGFFHLLLLSIPYFWIILTFLFIFLAYHYFKNTSGGHKFELWHVITLCISLSFLIGSLAYIAGGPRRFNHFSQQAPPFMHQLMMEDNVWSRPDDGLLAGVVIEQTSDDLITIKDLKNNIWTVDISSSIWMGKGNNPVGKRVQIIGRKVSDQKIEAFEIRPDRKFEFDF